MECAFKSRFEKLSNLWKGVIKTTFDESSVRFQYRREFSRGVHEYGDFSFVVTDTELRLSQRESSSIEKQSEPFPLPEAKMLLDAFIKKIANETYACSDMYDYHLRDVFGFPHKVNVNNVNQNEQNALEQNIPSAKERLIRQLSRVCGIGESSPSDTIPSMENEIITQQ